ncbi:Ig-like domain-containing protein [Erwinia tracheiphila]|uniref:Ig-like domain-containing protein n=1 Tax=Erwinia tracheiphila TaxID=65700 RepID=UPI001F3200D9|nr:Ig-like domain-containing protein [Erwinia tracheiphila]UIA81850.1 Ig-like domain-containing protein [Erwinia tracheiphila]
MQAAFPLAAAFSPAIAGTGSNSRLLNAPTQSILQTQPYRLVAGETAATVAKKYNMTPEALKKLNQFRTFSRGFEGIQPGDELEVPLKPFPEIQWHEHSENVSATSQTSQPGQTEEKVARHVSQVGTFLANQPNSQAASSLARSMVSSAASAEIQQWMSGFGTARVQLETDKNLSLKNSQVDLLLPLHEQNNRLVFSQSSLHRTDDRTQINLGAGVRHFYDKWMFGMNTFFDHDLSQRHSRVGGGIEYWRDFVRVAVNGYLRLTNWQDAPHLTDYEARPANGWDIRTQGWLPTYPQLGGKLTLEQYYGNEVALFGKDNRQRNPYAVTAGMNYTPVPLLTFRAEQRQGAAGQSETLFGLSMNYQPGVPWRLQTDPKAVAGMRSLMNSRYDLVERNNNIVLEYRKKEVISLRTAPLLTGYAGQYKSLGASVNSKYAFSHINWTAPSLIAAGGKIVDNNGDYGVVLPDYQSAQNGINTYSVDGVAVDQQGNHSKRASTTITVTQAAIATHLSSLTPSEIQLPADGKTQQRLVLKVNDSEGNPVDIDGDEISVTRTAMLRRASDTVVSAFVRQAPGEYVTTVTAGTVPEAFTLTPGARNADFAPARVVLTADKTTALIDTVEVVSDNAIADGQAQNVIKITVVDAHNNPVAGKVVTLRANNETSVVGEVETSDDGSVNVPVTSLRAGETILTASVSSAGSKEVKLTFLSDQHTARVIDSNLSILPAVSLADGKESKTISAIVTDANGNPVPGLPVAFSADNGALTADNSVLSDAQGRATTLLSSKVAGLSRVSASVNNTTTVKETTFIANSATALVTSVEAVQASGIADGKTAVTFRALIKDENGNPLPDIPVDWKSNKDDGIVTFAQAQTQTNSQGVAEIAVASIRAFTDVVVTASTNASSKAASPFTFIADKASAQVAQLGSDKLTLTANGTDSVRLSVRVEDSYGNPLPDMNVTLSSDRGGTVSPSALVSGGDGFAYATLTGTEAGVMTVTARLDNAASKTLPLTALADTQTASVKVKSDSATAAAGQSQPVTLTATVVDSHNNPVADLSVAWQSTHNQLSLPMSVTNAQGEALVHLTGTTAQLTTITAALHNGNKGTAQVTFTPGVPAQENSVLTVSPQTITADGHTSAVATLILKDRWNNPVLNQPVNWAADSASGITLAAAETGNGLYQATVTGTREGTWPLTANSGSLSLQTPIGMLASQDSAEIDSVTISGSQIAKADGVETVTFRAQVKDKNGNTKLSGVAVGWDTNLGNLSSRISSSDENGIAEITLSSRAAGQARVSAMLGGGVPVSAARVATFTAGTVDAGRSSLNVSPASIVAETENATATVTARDAEGNLLTGLKNKLGLTFSTALDTTLSGFTEVSSGVYQAKVTGTTAGRTNITAVVDGVTVTEKASLTIVADNTAAVVKGNITVSSTSASVGETVTYSATLTDKNGNALGAGIPVTWSANEGSTLQAQVTRTDDSGTARVALTRLIVGTATVQLILPSGSTSAPDVTFSTGAADESRSALTLSPSVIVAGKETAELVLILRDKHGNLLSGQSVRGVSSNADVSVAASQQSSDAPGRYTMTVSGNKTGTALLSVTVGSQTFSQTRTLTINGDTDSWKISQVIPDRTHFNAGDSQGVTYSATVVDSYGNVLPGVVVSWQLREHVGTFMPTSRTDSNGIATTTVLSNTAGQLHMTAWLDSNNSLQAATVNVAAGNIKQASLTADKTMIGSDGKDTVTFTTYLEDRYGNPVTGKTVVLRGANTLSGFTLSAVADKGNGLYMATATATTKGEVTISAQVDNQTVGNSVKVIVGAIIPDLRFPNAQQNTVWTSNFTESQSVTGMPKGVTQIWTVSDESVVRIDNNGRLTLLKAGEASVSVYTPGNAQYTAAMANYYIRVAKADPQLKAGSGEPVTAMWRDGVDRTIAASYGNSDARRLLTPVYASRASSVVTVDSSGRLTAVKPGTTVVSVSTPETDQFLPGLSEVTYVLNKASLDINFAHPEVKTTDQVAFSLQNPTSTFGPEAALSWASSNTSVVNVSAAGEVQGSVNHGQTRLTLTVEANDYYSASAGYYDVQVYTKPAISLGNVTYISRGTNGNSGTWTPVFTDDTLTVNWSAGLTNEFSRPNSAVVYIKDTNDNILSEFAVSSPVASNVVTFNPDTHFWGKTVRVEVVAKGYGNLETTASSPDISVRNLEPGQIWNSMTVNHFLTARSSAGNSGSCQETFLGREHWNVAIADGGSINFGGKRLLSPMRLSARARATQNGGNTSRDFPGTFDSVTTNQYVVFGATTVATKCWTDHIGGYAVILSVGYAGQTYTYDAPSRGWGGNGDGMNVRRVENYPR